MKPITFFYVVCYYTKFEEISRRLDRLNMPHCYHSLLNYKNAAGYYRIWTCSQAKKPETILTLSIGELIEEVVAITDFESAIQQMGFDGMKYLASNGNFELSMNINEHINDFLFI